MALGAMDVVDSVDVGGTMTIPVYPHQKPVSFFFKLAMFAT